MSSRRMRPPVGGRDHGYNMASASGPKMQAGFMSDVGSAWPTLTSLLPTLDEQACWCLKQDFEEVLANRFTSRLWRERVGAAGDTWNVLGFWKPSLASRSAGKSVTGLTGTRLVMPSDNFAVVCAVSRRGAKRYKLPTQIRKISGTSMAQGFRMTVERSRVLRRARMSGTSWAEITRSVESMGRQRATRTRVGSSEALNLRTLTRSIRNVSSFYSLLTFREENPERSYVGGSDDSILPDHAWLRLANPSWGLRRRCQPESPVCSAVSSGSLCNDWEPMWSPPQRGLSGQVEQSTKSDGDDESRQVAEPQEPTSMRKSWASASLLLQASRAGFAAHEWDHNRSAERTVASSAVMCAAKSGCGCGKDVQLFFVCTAKWHVISVQHECMPMSN